MLGLSERNCHVICVNFWFLEVSGFFLAYLVTCACCKLLCLSRSKGSCWGVLAFIGTLSGREGRLLCFSSSCCCCCCCCCWEDAGNGCGVSGYLYSGHCAYLDLLLRESRADEDVNEGSAGSPLSFSYLHLLPERGNNIFCARDICDWASAIDRRRPGH
jgi:hypothetical protein